MADLINSEQDVHPGHAKYSASRFLERSELLQEFGISFVFPVNLWGSLSANQSDRPLDDWIGAGFCHR